jgi:hypothetical protein
MPATGDSVLVPTEVGDGAFPSEKLVTVDTEEGPLSGFARNEQIVHQSGTDYLRAIVERVMDQTVTVKLSGSFFTTTGSASVNKRQLKQAG